MVVKSQELQIAQLRQNNRTIKILEAAKEGGYAVLSQVIYSYEMALACIRGS